PVNATRTLVGGNLAATRVLLNISTLTISVADGNDSLRDWRDVAFVAQGVRPPCRWPRRDACAVEGAGQAHPLPGPAPDRARRHARPRADHAHSHPRPARRSRPGRTRPRSCRPARLAPSHHREGTATHREAPD